MPDLINLKVWKYCIPLHKNVCVASIKIRRKVLESIRNEYLKYSINVLYLLITVQIIATVSLKIKKILTCHYPKSTASKNKNFMGWSCVTAR